MGTRTPKPLICKCEICSGRSWTLAEIRALPGVGEQVNGSRLSLINRANSATGHAFSYAIQTAVGTWYKAEPAGEPAKVEERRHVYGSESKAMPVNPKWLDVHCGKEVFG